MMKYLDMTEHQMSNTLKLAGVYNVLWGGWVVLFPTHFFELTGMDVPSQLSIWQGLGMVIGVYGLGYWWSAQNPTVHWPIVAVGFIGKIFGPLGFVINYAQDKVPFSFFYTLITNDFIWWIPFFLILRAAKRNGNLKLA
jgi:small multidrug resistance pump